MERELAQVVGIRDASLQKSASLMQEAWNMEESQRKGRELLANSFGQAEKVHAQLEEAKRGLDKKSRNECFCRCAGSSKRMHGSTRKIKYKNCVNISCSWNKAAV